MKKFGAIVLLLFLLVLIGVPAFLFVMSFFNGKVGITTDYAASPMLKTPPPPLKEPITVKVATFNIQDTWVVGQNRPERMRAIGAKLTVLDPDIVGFQEAFIDSERQILQTELGGSRLKYFQYYPSGTVGSGLFIASAWPIKEKYFSRYEAANPWYKVWEGDWWAGKGAALARIELPNGGTLDFYDTHAQARYGNAEYNEVQLSQLGQYAKFINGSRAKAPAIVVGDLNSKPDAAPHQRLVKDASLARMMRLDTRIDHIFVVNDPNYSFELLDTVEIAEKVHINGKEYDLSDHSGYMSTIRISPK